MAKDRIDPREPVPEADLLAKQARLTAQSLTDVEWLSTVPEGSVDADEADRLDHHAPDLGVDLGQLCPRAPRTVVMTDPLVEVAVRVHADFAEHSTPADVLAVIAQCRHDLDTPSLAALPELVERLARQRLADRNQLPTSDPG